MQSPKSHRCLEQQGLQFTWGYREPYRNLCRAPQTSEWKGKLLRPTSSFALQPGYGLQWLFFLHSCHYLLNSRNSMSVSVKSQKHKCDQTEPLKRQLMKFGCLVQYYAGSLKTNVPSMFNRSYSQLGIHNIPRSPLVTI